MRVKRMGDLWTVGLFGTETLLGCWLLVADIFWPVLFVEQRETQQHISKRKKGKRCFNGCSYLVKISQPDLCTIYVIIFELIFCFLNLFIYNISKKAWHMAVVVINLRRPISTCWLRVYPLPDEQLCSPRLEHSRALSGAGGRPSYSSR